MRSPVRALAVLALTLSACPAEQGDLPVSGSADPSIIFDVVPPDVLAGWPCPPFAIETTEDLVDDDDEDTLTDCQEIYLGSDPNDPDTDGDGVLDAIEISDPGDPRDTDRDDIPDILETDDDDDGVPTADEDATANGGNGDGDPRDDDFDGDGLANYLDVDDDGDGISGRNTRAPELCACAYVPPIGVLWEDTNMDGDPTNDDLDGDLIPNRLDTDDEGDGVLTVDDVRATVPRFDDVDLDCVPDWMDTDDNGDGIPTALQDWDGSGSVLDDDLDGDRIPDFQDADEDGDNVLTWYEGTSDDDGDGAPNYRDTDDDDDGVATKDEDVEKYFNDEPPKTPAAATTDTCEPLSPPDPEQWLVGAVVDDDTDDDGLLNYLDADDDGDGCLTIDEDKDQDGKVTDDLGPTAANDKKLKPYYLDGAEIPAWLGTPCTPTE